jgi:hypothetical protein
LRAPNKTTRGGRHSIHQPTNVVEESFAMRILGIVLGLVFAAIAVAYWMVPAGSLPTFFPGFEAGSAHIHVKHGIASALVAVVLFGLGWYVGRSR